jgi:hypothetical protein
MKVYLEIVPGAVIVRWSQHGPHGLIADCQRTILPGENLSGVPYTKLLKHGDGAIEVEDPSR